MHLQTCRLGVAHYHSSLVCFSSQHWVPGHSEGSLSPHPCIPHLSVSSVPISSPPHLTHTGPQVTCETSRCVSNAYRHYNLISKGASCKPASTPSSCSWLWGGCWYGVGGRQSHPHGTGIPLGPLGPSRMGGVGSAPGVLWPHPYRSVPPHRICGFVSAWF